MSSKSRGAARRVMPGVGLHIMSIVTSTVYQRSCVITLDLTSKFSLEAHLLLCVSSRRYIREKVSI